MKKNKKKQESLKQARIAKANAPFNKELSKAVTDADGAIQDLEEMYKLWKTGNVATGTKGWILPMAWQSDETQVFEGLANDLANKLLSGKGAASKFKIEFAKSTKPEIKQGAQAQKRLMDYYYDRFQRIRLLDAIRNDIIEKNNNIEPNGLETKVKAEFKKAQRNPERYGISYSLDKANNQEKEIADMLKSGTPMEQIVDPKDYQEGDIIPAGFKYWKKVGNSWVETKGV